MRKFYSLLLSSSLLLFSSIAMSATSPAIVELQTNLGTIAVKLDYAHAPISANNFITYVNSGFYKKTIFHRVIKGFMIQGGGFDKNAQYKTPRAAITLESNNGLKNLKGTIAMARSSDPNSATSQFFINLVDNNFLNYSAPTSTGWGYAVFGTVIRGMETTGIINTIANAPNSWSLYCGSVNSCSSNIPFVNNQLVYIDNAYSSASVDTGSSKTRITLDGSGSVSSVPAGINCGTSCVLSTSTNTTVKLTAKPATGYAFAGWRGDCQGYNAVISLNAIKGINHNCTASFIKAPAAIQ
ncbi:MAG: peptidylprolyl isomerase [Methylococcaceae bacterium]